MTDRLWRASGQLRAGFDHARASGHEVRRALQAGWIETVRGVGHRFVTADDVAAALHRLRPTLARLKAELELGSR